MWKCENVRNVEMPARRNNSEGGWKCLPAETIVKEGENVKAGNYENLLLTNRNSRKFAFKFAFKFVFGFISVKSYFCPPL
jgi:hypothetical protein